MKRTIYLLVVTVLAAGTLAAQNRGMPGPSWGPGFGPGRRMPSPSTPSPSVPDPQRPNFWGNRDEAREKVSLSGPLGFSNGYISLEQDGLTYYILGLDRLIGFVDGLKEGARVSLEGYVFTPRQDTNIRILRAEKLIFNGREYEGLSPLLRNLDPGTRGQFPPAVGHYHHFL